MAAAAVLLPIAKDALAVGANEGIKRLINGGGGNKYAADQTFGSLYNSCLMALHLTAAARTSTPDDANLIGLEIVLRQMEAAAFAGTEIFDKAPDPKRVETTSPEQIRP